MKLFIKVIAVLILASFLFTSIACHKNDMPEIPDDMTREQAALFTAVAAVCPKDKNNSKVDYLTFCIKGWSFSSMPEAIVEYLSEYAMNGECKVIDKTFDELIEQGYISNGDGEFFDKDELTYMDGKGKMFTFELVGDTETDSVVVKLTGFISEKDQSGYDINLAFSNGKWSVESYSNSWGAAYMLTAEPTA